jgi:hypothetical protein
VHCSPWLEKMGGMQAQLERHGYCCQHCMIVRDLKVQAVEAVVGKGWASGRHIRVEVVIFDDMSSCTSDNVESECLHTFTCTWFGIVSAAKSCLFSLSDPCFKCGGSD